ncbi:hypothetical protein [Halorussus halophilus]|uniref:hypothetical protein n=1 Tax=Halorussus halophilus TaxID=2650975 RepID=UPI001301776F|nr:hypothetical protein [Halorussus halophilus]
MTTVWEVASEAEMGDRIKWIGEDADVKNPEASTVTRMLREDGMITVEAEGPGGVDVCFWVKEDGTSKVLHQGDEQGPVDAVELLDKNIGTRRFSD